LDTLKSNTITIRAAKGKSPEELEGKLLVGTLFQDNQKPEFSKSYFKTAEISRSSARD